MNSYRGGENGTGLMTSGRVICAGGCVVDRKLKLTGPAVVGTSNPARAVTSFGGVARNVAENLARLGTPVELVSRVGDDDSGRAVIAYLADLGVDVTGVSVALSGETAQYVAVLDSSGDLVLGAAAMDVLDGLAPADLDATWPSSIEPNSWVFADCNLPIDTLAHAVRRGRIEGTKLAVDAVSTPKVGRLPRDLTGVEVLFCNLDEAQALAIHHGWPLTGNALDLVELLHDHGAAHVVLSRGADGLVIGDADGIRMVPATAASVFDVTGAGDSLIAGTLTLLAAGAGLDDAVLAGTLVAALTVESHFSVRPDLSADLVDAAALHRLRRPGMIAASRASADDALGTREFN
ncbi:MAG: carbohydrate kinase family protein [Kineosporiaceae bacterium]|nr:carbohydrate kinase family protein [Kineosporiaceae bacterium]